MLESSTRGDPQSPLLWTSKSTRHLADALVQQGHHVSHHTIARVSRTCTIACKRIGKRRKAVLIPILMRHSSISRRKSGRFRNAGNRCIGGREEEGIDRGFQECGAGMHPQGQPVKVRSKDFLDKQLGKGIPYGVYDITAKNGWVSVGIDLDAFVACPRIASLAADPGMSCDMAHHSGTGATLLSSNGESNESTLRQ